MGMFDEVLDNVGEQRGSGKGFEYGTHEVIIGEVASVAKKTKANDAAPVIEVVVFDEADNDRKATCTLYFHTEGGAQMSVKKILGIMVHNVGEEKKDKVRELGRQLFGKIDDPTKARDIAFKLMQDKMITKKAYLVAEPQGKYTTTAYGDLWHYAAEPESKPVTVVAPVAGGEDITEEVGDDMPNFEDL